MNIWQDFHGPNAGYILELYERYQQDPDSVDPQTRSYFEDWSPTPTDGTAVTAAVADSTTVDQIGSVVGAVNLAQAIREYGHLAAQLDPLGSESLGDPSLDLSFHNVAEAELQELPARLIGGPIAEQKDTAWEAIGTLREVYSTCIGYDYDHLRVPEEREWLRQAAESRQFRPPHSPIDEEALLKRLTQVEAFEKFLHRAFPGKTRFSCEGVDMLVPMLDEIIYAAAASEIYNIMLGMAHRGRLNVLAHVLNKPYAQILAEFKDPVRGRGFFIRDDLGWTGDVKYHLGAGRAVEGSQEVDMMVHMVPNPSHLEAVNPVVVGMARAAGTYVDESGPPRFDHAVSLPILIHGDAAFSGQGIVSETLNFSRLSGYETGGTIHIITNNQLGYTTLPSDSRSTIYASDLAKGFKIPIVHVNADNPVSCLEVARLAFAYRAKFNKDFLIDLIGYRRYGHNEGDEPSFTQPVLYQVIDKHPTVREQWGKKLVERDLIDDEEKPEAMLEEKMRELQEIQNSLEPEEDLDEPPPKTPPPGAAGRVETGVSLQKLRKIFEELNQFPEEFNLNSKLQRVLKRRRKALENPDETTVDWSTAEQLAFASILADGTAIRMTGQDVERGTFSQRHAVLHDMEEGHKFTPLQTFSQSQAAFEIHNSPLTENAVLGFEFGYNVQEPKRLILWEAQYGDFVNGAQVIIDEFLTSGRAKWGLTPSLVMLLPHGYEGQGPDHSTGRLERFLQMAAETNMRIANCTTAAQYFHLLRRQVALLETDPLPLIILTPKSLLRHPKVASTPRSLAESRWQPVIDDEQTDPEKARRLIFCSGKVYVDLITSDYREGNQDVAIVRLEQLYPFPFIDLKNLVDTYSNSNLQEIVWVQEEPQSMGAWKHVRPRLETIIGGRYPLHYLGRPRSSSPAEGSLAWHNANQKKLIEQAFNLDENIVKEDIILWESILREQSS